ncbi:hypothetical protein AB1L42_12665 [Thalassoglobus sp. JC818]|uniref:hypothetical protein n=1 Tax=Thalassoglobus sp. JC818 TaxID=3232136 RepID=UPI00345A2C0C
MNLKFFVLTSYAIVVFSVGCSGQPGTESGSTTAHDHEHHHGDGPAKIEAPVNPSEAGEQYVLTEEPADALNVIEARESTEADSEIVVFGQIGGSHEPFVDGRAMFTVVDDSLESCNEIPGDSCPTPWDYCCETPKLKGATALVKVVDANGEPVKTDARELLGVRELTSVIVKGNAQRDDAGNLTILASSIYVKK